MTAALEPNPEAPRPELTEGEEGRAPDLLGGRYGTTSLRVGAASIWLSIIVLLPLAAILWQSAGGGWNAFWLAITSNAAVESFRVTLTISAGVTLVNLVFGLLVAWVLTRDDFVGKRLVDSVIDLPFALPTIVASLVMLALYGPNSPVDLHLQHTKWGVGIALLFVTLPFVVRSVQPVLLELDRETEEAAASLGASNWTIFTKVMLPALLPSLLSGAGLAFSRAIGEFGSVVLIGGAVPGETEVSSQWIRTLIENDDRTGAAAISIVLLVISFVVLFILRVVGSRAAKRQDVVTGRAAPPPLPRAGLCRDPGHRARRADSVAYVHARYRGVLRLDNHPGGGFGTAAVAACGRDRRAP